MAEIEGYKEDVVALPTDGLDDKRFASNNSGSFTVPHTEGMDNKYPGDGLSVTNPRIPYEPGENPVHPTFGENDFPRQTGHDSLPDGDITLT